MHPDGDVQLLGQRQVGLFSNKNQASAELFASDTVSAPELPPAPEQTYEQLPTTAELMALLLRPGSYTIETHAVDGEGDHDVDFPVRDYRLEAWNGSAWVVLDVVTGNTQLHRTHAFPAATSTLLRVVGLRGPDLQPQHVRVNEVEVYAN